MLKSFVLARDALKKFWKHFFLPQFLNTPGIVISSEETVHCA